jgi:hypothetical protein
LNVEAVAAYLEVRFPPRQFHLRWRRGCQRTDGQPLFLVTLVRARGVGVLHA